MFDICAGFHLHFQLRGVLSSIISIAVLLFAFKLKPEYTFGVSILFLFYEYVVLCPAGILLDLGKCRDVVFKCNKEIGPKKNCCTS